MGSTETLLEAEGFDALCRTVQVHLGIDLAAYRSRQLLRRLDSFAQRAGAAGLHDLARLLARDAQLRERFRQHLTINVTEFLRNPDKWRELSDHIVPRLLQERGTLRAWSAGCSRGAEPYSLALVLAETGKGGACEILATDIDEEVLAQARAGVYGSDELRHVPPLWRNKYFEPAGDGAWRVGAQLRAGVTFRRQDLLRDPFPAGLDLILCRNVIIYFTEEAKTQLFHRFGQSLRPGGCLWLGATESLFRPERYGLTASGSGFYRKSTEGGTDDGHHPHR